MKKIIALILGVLCVVMTSVVYAAPVGKLRTSISPARVRIVLDSQVPIEYKVEKKGLKLELDLPQSSSQSASLLKARTKACTCLPLNSS